MRFNFYTGSQNIYSNCQAGKKILDLEAQKAAKEKELQNENNSLSENQTKAKNKVWDIKTNYSGGDRVLEFCLEGYKNDGIKLLNYVEFLVKPDKKPQKSIEELKEEVQSIAGDKAQKLSKLAIYHFPGHDIENDPIYKKQITGNENSTVAEFISKFENADWVKEGLEYLPAEMGAESETCPFCQEKTISKKFIQSIREYFDESYENDLNKLKNLSRNLKVSKFSAKSKLVIYRILLGQII